MTKSTCIFGVLILLLCAMGAVFAIHGPRTCHDATGYIMGAVSLRLHGEYRSKATDSELLQQGMDCEIHCPKNAEDLQRYRDIQGDGAQTHWAVGYPFAVSILSRLPFFNVRRAFLLLHLLCLAAACAAVRAILKTLPSAWNTTSALLFAIFFSTFLWLLAMVTFSEVLFLPLALWSLFLLCRHCERKNDFLCLLGAALLAGYGVLTRYAGLYQAPAAVLIILIYSRRKWLGKLAEAAVFSIITILPFILWQYRNYCVSGTLRGSRISPTDYLLRLQDFYYASGSLMFPVPQNILAKAPHIIHAVCAVPAAVVAAFLIMHFLTFRKKCRLPMRLHALLFSAAAYLGFILLTQAVTGEPYPFDFRVMLPMNAPLCLAFMMLLNHAPLTAVSSRIVLPVLGLSSLWNILYCIGFLCKQLSCAW